MENDAAVVSGRGGLFIFEKDIIGNFIETKLTAQFAVNAIGGSTASIGIDGDLIVVGSTVFSKQSTETWSDGNWTEHQLAGSENPLGFGISSAIDGSVAIIGADEINVFTGSAYLFDNLQTEPVILGPEAGRVLADAGGNELFEWTPGLADVSEWWLYVGSQLGGNQYFDSQVSLQLTTLSQTVTNLPQDGSSIYARLWWRVNGDPVWRFVDEVYTAGGLTPAITSPAANTQLPGAIGNFTWSDNGAGATDYWLYAGSSVGASNYFSSGSLGINGAVTATGLPTDGTSTVYVRLWYRIGSGPWLFVDETYTEGTGTAPIPVLNAPSPPGPFTDSTGTESLTWLENSSGAAEYWVYAGFTQGGNQYDDTGSLGNILTTTVSNLPTDGSTVWIRLWYRGSAGGTWQFVDESYTAVSQLPQIDSSSDNGVLTSPTDTFTWSDPTTTVTEWWLYAGSTVGGDEHYDSGSLGGATTDVASNLPIGGQPVYVRLWYRVGAGAWLFIDEVFTSAP